MAIIIEEGKRKFNFVALGVIFVIFVFVVLVAYYLFFAPTPRFDVIVPAGLDNVGRIADFDLDPSVVLDSPQFRSLRKFSGAPGEGTIGRANPFLPF